MLFPNQLLPSLPDADLQFYEQIIEEKESKLLFEALTNNVGWKSESIKIFGKSIPQPRLTAFYGDQGKAYTYSGITMHPKPWTAELTKIKLLIEKITGHRFSCVLLNFYRSGKDSMGWHSDDESTLGKNPVIASLSLGANRKFMLKHKINARLKHSMILTDASLLVMKGKTQHSWLHQVPKTQKAIGPRINLTFRKLV